MSPSLSTDSFHGGRDTATRGRSRGGGDNRSHAFYPVRIEAPPKRRNATARLYPRGVKVTRRHASQQKRDGRARIHRSGVMFFRVPVGAFAHRKKQGHLAPSITAIQRVPRRTNKSRRACNGREFRRSSPARRYTRMHYARSLARSLSFPPTLFLSLSLSRDLRTSATHFSSFARSPLPLRREHTAMLLLRARGNECVSPASRMSGSPARYAPPGVQRNFRWDARERARVAISRRSYVTI